MENTIATFDQLLEKLNSLKIIQKSFDWLEDLPDDLYEQYFENIYICADELDIERHRWYETCIQVFEIPVGEINRYLGVRYLNNSYSESQMIEDCSHELEFFEMNRTLIPRYEYTKK